MSRVSIMIDDCKAGISLIAGSLGGILTMAIHPTAGGSPTGSQAANLSMVSGIAHSIAMISVLALFLGGWGISKRTAAADRMSFTAIVTYGFACIAIVIAAAVSGFIIPGIMKHMVRDVPDATHQWQIVIVSIFEINQAFARIYSVAASMAIILWSISALRNGGFGRGVAIYGCVVAPLTVVGVATGHLRLDVHGMAVVLLGQAIWFIVVGIQLCSRPITSLSRQ